MVILNANSHKDNKESSGLYIIYIKMNKWLTEAREGGIREWMNEQLNKEINEWTNN